MRRQMQSRSRCRSHRKKQQKANRAKAARHGAAEGQQPHRIDAKVGPVGMNESIGDKCPHIRPATRKCAAEYEGIVITRRDESEIEQEFDVLLLAQQECADDVNKRQHGQHNDDNGWNVEERFAFHEKGPMRNVSYAASPLRRKPHAHSPKEKGRAFALP